MNRRCLLVIFGLIFAVLACNFGRAGPPADLPAPGADQAGESQPTTGRPPDGGVLLPEDLEYLGAFRLPDASGGSNWEYSGQGLTYYPQGDPGGPDDGFPGSLFGIGHDHHMMASEISIPVPVVTKQLGELNTAETLQPFADLSAGVVDFEMMDLPVADLAYLPAEGGQGKGKLHFTYGQHFQDFEASHGWISPDLANPDPAGPWIMDAYTNYVTNDYLFAIPPDWAAAHAPGQVLATGRFREGVWGGYGPALFAYAPPGDSNPPAAGSVLASMTPLLLYGVQEPAMTDIRTSDSMQMNAYLSADHWLGGAWLSSGDRSAVIFVGTKALGTSWYGFANGVTWDYDCAQGSPPTCPDPPEWPYDNRGYWADAFQAQIIFYNPGDLAAVAGGLMQTWEPQPYASLSLDEYLFAPELDLAEYKRDLVAAAAYDPVNDHLFIFERLADGYKSVIHVWGVGD